jgi:hypothetical protein
VGSGAEDAEPLDVANSEILFRYVHRDYWVSDGEGGRRLSSAFMAIEPEMDGLSVYSATLLTEAGYSADDVPPDPTYGLACLTTGAARDLGFDVIPDPQKERPIDIAHMLITGPTEKLSRKARRRLSSALIERVELRWPPKTK